MKILTGNLEIELCSAVFGTEIWPAAEYGRTMYTIRQRIGPLLMKMEKRYGPLLCFCVIYSLCKTHFLGLIMF